MYISVCVCVCVLDKRTKNWQMRDFDETAAGSDRRTMRHWLRHFFVLSCTLGCALVLYVMWIAVAPTS